MGQVDFSRRAKLVASLLALIRTPGGEIRVIPYGKIIHLESAIPNFKPKIGSIFAGATTMLPSYS